MTTTYTRKVRKRELRSTGVTHEGKLYGHGSVKLVVDHLECGHVVVEVQMRPVRECADCAFAAESRTKRRA